MRTPTFLTLLAIALCLGCEEAKPTPSRTASRDAAPQQLSQLEFLDQLSASLLKLADEMNAIKTVADLEIRKAGLLATLGSIETMIQEFEPASAPEIDDAADISQIKSNFQTALSAIDDAKMTMPIEVRQTDFVKQELSREFTRMGNSLKSLGKKAKKKN